MWLADRVQPAKGRGVLTARPALLIGARCSCDPMAMPCPPRPSTAWCAAWRSEPGSCCPARAAAHAFRHHYGVTLALRGVPGNVISQLTGHADPRTTSIYTTAASTQLVTALDDTGLLG